MEMASTTGGKYFRASDNLRLEQIYEEINKMEKTEFDKDEAQARQAEFLPLMFWIAFFMALPYNRARLRSHISLRRRPETKFRTS